MQAACKTCIYDKNINHFPADATPELAERYQAAVTAILRDCPDTLTAPEAAHQIRDLRMELFEEAAPDYTEIKRHFNALMLDEEERLQCAADHAPDPVLRAAQYAMTGNFVDFSALGNVEESKLAELLDKAPEIRLDPDTCARFLETARRASSLAYITDNCGEIVLDKILIRTLLKINPGLSVTVIVRGAPVANDATMEDALQVGMPDLSRVIGNGTDIDGTVLSKISEEARGVMTRADFLIAKGQANYETLNGCGLNIFYLFMCKCILFTERFQVPQFSGILAAELEE